MASFRSPPECAGYATAAAMVFCLAFALIAAASIERSVAALRLSRADFDLMRVEYGLAGSHLEAAAAVVRTGRPPPYHWTFASEGGWVEARAEPERDKLGLEAASRLSDEVLEGFGVADPDATRARLAEAATMVGEVIDVGALDLAPLWRACAPALISSQGTAEAMSAMSWSTPTSGHGPRPQSWRIGETWRMQITTAAGWRDERIVRFTGDAGRPAATVLRRLTRTSGGGGECDSVWAAATGG